MLKFLFHITISNRPTDASPALCICASGCRACLLCNLLHAKAPSCRNLPPLQVLNDSVSTFAAILVLLALFWFVVSVLGLHILGGLPLDTPWPNCNSLLNCLILNFHVSPGGLKGRSASSCNQRESGTLADAGAP